MCNYVIAVDNRSTHLFQPAEIDDTVNLKWYSDLKETTKWGSRDFRSEEIGGSSVERKSLITQLIIFSQKLNYV